MQEPSVFVCERSISRVLSKQEAREKLMKMTENDIKQDLVALVVKEHIFMLEEGD